MAIARQLARRLRRRARRAVPGLLAAAAGVDVLVDQSHGVIALTLDDGPDPIFTPLALDALSTLGVRATFFLVGQRATAHPSLVERIADAGHAIGSHSDSHPDPWTLSPLALLLDYRRGRRAVEEAAGRRVTLFRPPKGHLDIAGVAAIRASGLDPWLWSLDTEDWMPGADVGRITSRAQAMRARDVLLLHDGIAGPGTPPEALDRTATIEALPSIVHHARAEGLSLVRLR